MIKRMIKWLIDWVVKCMMMDKMMDCTGRDDIGCNPSGALLRIRWDHYDG